MGRVFEAAFRVQDLPSPVGSIRDRSVVAFCPTVGAENSTSASELSRNTYYFEGLTQEYRLLAKASKSAAGIERGTSLSYILTLDDAEVCVLCTYTHTRETSSSSAKPFHRYSLRSLLHRVELYT